MKRLFTSPIVLIALAVSGCSSGEDAVVGAAGIEGKFSAIVHLRPHSLERVHIDIYEDFTCPACQQLEATGIPALKQEFDQRIVIRRHYLAGPGTAPSAKILYDIADDSGIGQTVADALFKAALKHGDDTANLPEVREIAAKYRLEESFEKAYRDGSGKARIMAEWNATHRKIPYFPFVVFENDIATSADSDNIAGILRSLLKVANAPR